MDCSLNLDLRLLRNSALSFETNFLTQHKANVYCEHLLKSMLNLGSIVKLEMEPDAVQIITVVLYFALFTDFIDLRN